MIKMIKGLQYLLWGKGDTWDSSGWRRGSLGRGKFPKNLSIPEGRAHRRERWALPQWCPMAGQEANGTNWNTRYSLATSGNTSVLRMWLTTGTDCPEDGSLLHGALQKSPGHGPERPALSFPAWARRATEPPVDISHSGRFCEYCDTSLFLKQYILLEKKIKVTVKETILTDIFV